MWRVEDNSSLRVEEGSGWGIRILLLFILQVGVGGVTSLCLVRVSHKAFSS